MAPETMPEPEGPEDERFVYVVTAAGVEALREGAVVVDGERKAARGRHCAAPSTSYSPNSSA